MIPPRQKIAVYNGVAVRDRGLLDATDHEPEYKQALCDALANATDDGDHVCMVGGGRGVAAVHAARAGARVDVFEAAEEMVALVGETARLNDVELTVKHAIVGSVCDPYGSTSRAKRVGPESLAGDILVLDCEGAETDILPVAGFETVIVETHPRFGAPTEDVVEATGGEVVAPDPIDGEVVVG